MSNAFHPSRTRFADLALATYLAPVLVGRRVAVVGPSSGEVARRIRGLGAASVVAFGGVGEDVAVRALTPGALAAFHGKIDAVVVPDAGALPSLVATLDEARRALGSEGIVVIASQPEDAPSALEAGGKHGPGYHDLREMCLERFSAVRMVGRGPFVAYTIATLDEAAVSVGLDTRLIDGDPPRPESYIAVASDSGVALDALTVVQVPGELLNGIREAATQGLTEELSKRDQKLKEVEAASAERWVKIQRYEHGIKELEEETRKTRDRAVRLSKELEDERKLRQRIELEAQMVRRAPELPKAPDLEPELRIAREAITSLERELARSRAESVAVQAKVVTVERDLAVTTRSAAVAAEGFRTRMRDLEREIDETQAVEADLRAQLDEAIERAETTPVPVSVPAPVDDSRATLEAEYARIEAALHERSATVLRLEKALVVRDASIRELAFSLASPRGSAGPADDASWKARFLEAASVHAALADHAEAVVGDNTLLRGRIAALDAQAVTLAGEAQQAVWNAHELQAELDRAGHEHQHAVEALHRRVAMLEGAFGGVTVRAREHELSATELARSLADERGGRSHDRSRDDETRTELARLHALVAGVEARAALVDAELDALQLSSQRRISELEDTVAALAAQPAAPPPEFAALLDDDDERPTASRFGLDQVMSDLSATAERLAVTEEAFVGLQEAHAGALAEIEALRGTVGLVAETDLLAATEDVRQLLAQEQERSRAFAEALDERDRGFVTFERQVIGEISALKQALSDMNQVNLALRNSLAVIRAGLSAILIDGRGAVVAHDLVLLLRQIEASA